MIVEVDISELFGRRNIVHYLTVDLEKIAKLVHYVTYFHYLTITKFDCTTTSLS